ncbi:MAG: putative Ig domain-containing protein [Acidobacteriota bacterium]
MFRILGRSMVVIVVMFAVLASSPHPLLGQGLPDLRTPRAPEAPHINGPKVYGARAGHPFLYRIPCSGVRPMRFSVEGLPKSLVLDPETGIISGTVPKAEGSYRLIIKASNRRGRSRREFAVVVGEKLSLTPQMGWNDWYTHYTNITDKDIREAADAMIASGMADYGYQFIDIDDAWERKPVTDIAALKGPMRDEAGHILPNGRFPDMKALTDYVHARGLRAGIYSSPGPLTCGGFAASFGHEADDAALIAGWGFDLLKYDLCSYRKQMKDPHSVSELKAPYLKMGTLLNGQDRDIVFNLCEYGWGDVWKWARDVSGSSWRTTNDVGAVKGDLLPGFYKVGFANAALDAYAGPGAWNDPDYLIIGADGDPHNLAAGPQPTHLTAGEQYSYMSMWTLMASPLFFSGDMARLDPLTLNILENSEVIDVDQDVLGKQGKIVRHTDQEFILMKPMADGSTVVGLFNISEAPRSIKIDFKDIGATSAVTVRDVWRQQNVGRFGASYTAEVPRHDVMMIRITPAQMKRGM